MGETLTQDPTRETGGFIQKEVAAADLFDDLLSEGSLSDEDSRQLTAIRDRLNGTINIPLSEVDNLKSKLAELYSIRAELVQSDETTSDDGSDNRVAQDALNDAVREILDFINQFKK